MGEFGRGITAFKQGIRDSVESQTAPVPIADPAEVTEPTRQV
jgi:hypothetical protein